MTNRFDVVDSPIEGLKLINRKPIIDERGFLCRFFCEKEFSEMGFAKSISQINHVYSKRSGSVRGLHFQYPPAAEAKIVTCIRGKVYDVAVDIRQGSPTFLKWHAVVLSADVQNSLFIPEGFAHGYQTLVDDCELLYLHSVSFCPEAAGALNVLDPAIAIQWPDKITEMSDRDRQHKSVGAEFKGVVL